MSSPELLRTNLARSDRHNIWVRGHNLADELMGNVTFSDMVWLILKGEIPDPPRRRLLDAVLVALVEHGLTPSAVVARVNYWLVPEALQSAVASGLLGAGSVLLGSMEDCAHMLQTVAQAVDGGQDEAEAIRQTIDEFRQAGRRLPGFGHPLHRDGDPRARRLLLLASECGFAGRYVRLLGKFPEQMEAALGKQLPINATGAIAATLLELDVPPSVQKGFALISRTLGLIGHIQEEQHDAITPIFRKYLQASNRGDH